ncbi:MAG: TrkA family potassium uptake protein [Erysipelotrichaceae bacterium]|jgi:trk system potassium uptake protein TrkA|nr:TrkA family potassium uptake protein [Erysipelotrichaceae bacterium]
MKTILLIGLGRFGRHIARKMNELDMQVMAVDKDEDKVASVVPYVTNSEVGDATDKEYLRSLGVTNFDDCIVAIGDDFLASLEVTAYLKELGAKKVISRAARDTQEKFLLRNGADEVVYPEKIIGNWTAIRCSSDSISDYIQLGDDFAIYELEIPKGWIGKTIGEIGVRHKYNINVIAIKHGTAVTSTPGADYTLAENEKLLVLGHSADINKLLKSNK